MKTISITFAAGQTIKFDLLGNYFQVLETTSGIDIGFIRDGAVFAEAKNMEFGFASRPEGGFTGLIFTSALAQTIKIVVGLGDGSYIRSSGSVQVIGNQGAFNQVAATVGIAAGWFVNTNPNRKFLMIQNNHATSNIYVSVSNSFSMAAALKVAPGATLVFDTYCPTGYVMGQSDVVNSAVVVVEG
jgi:hypothetical protein